MQTPTLQTFAVPAFILGANTNGAPVAHATDKPVRVLLNNDGPTMIFVALRVQSLQSPGSKAVRIPPGDSRVFVLAPNDFLFAVSVGVGGILGAEISEAFPPAGVL